MLSWPIPTCTESPDDPLICGALFGAAVGSGPTLARVGRLVLFKPDMIAIFDEVLDSRPVACLRGRWFVKVGPVIALEGEITTCGREAVGLYETCVEFVGGLSSGVDDQRKCLAIDGLLASEVLREALTFAGQVIRGAWRSAAPGVFRPHCPKAVINSERSKRIGGRADRR